MRGFLWASLCVTVTAGVLLAQPAPAPAGRATFERLCARCHGGDGRGGELGPGIVARLGLRSDDELSAIVRDGIPAKGMPGLAMADDERRALLTFLRTLRPGRGETPVRLRATLATGDVVAGIALNQSSVDAQLLGDDGRLHLLRRAGSAFRRVTSTVDWPTYHGSPDGNRYSPVDQINASTVSRLAPAWVFPIPDAGRLQVTPVVVDGVMYITKANECHALDAGSGRRIWHFSTAAHPRARG